MLQPPAQDRQIKGTFSTCLHPQSIPASISGVFPLFCEGKKVRFCFRSFQVRPFSTLKLLVWRTPCIRRRFKAGGLKDLFPALLNSSPIKPAVPVSSRGRREEKKQENAHPKNGHLQSRCWQTVTFSVANVWYPSVVNTPPCFQPLLQVLAGAAVCTISYS